MRGAAEALGGRRCLRAAQLGEHLRRLLEEGVDELGDEIGARGFAQLLERGEVDHGLRRHVMNPCER